MFEAGMSQRDLAPQAGFSQSGLYRRLSGEVDFKVAELARLAKALKVPLDTLLNDPGRAA